MSQITKPSDQSNSGRPRRERKQQEEAPWIPKTILGKKVASGEITSLEEIIQNGSRIQEAGIIKKLLPDLKTEVIDVGLIQKMTANGCLLYTSPSPRDAHESRMPSSA